MYIKDSSTCKEEVPFISTAVQNMDLLGVLRFHPDNTAQRRKEKRSNEASENTD